MNFWLMRAFNGIALVVTICAIFGWLAFIGGAFCGAGHGSAFFLVALFSPFFSELSVSTLGEFAYAGFLLWPVVGILLALRSISKCRIAVIALLAVHYFGVLLQCLYYLQPDWYYVSKVCSSSSGLVLAFLGCYVGAQVFIWTLISRSHMQARRDTESLHPSHSRC